MRRLNTFLLITASLFAIACSRQPETGMITGETALKDASLTIGSKHIKTDSEGKFTARFSLEYPRLVDAAFAGREWTMYLEPGTEIRLSIPKNFTEKIDYSGDLAAENRYLSSLDGLSEQVNEEFNSRWQELFVGPQEELVNFLDSLKTLYLTDLKAQSKGDNALGAAFQKIWEVELHYGLNWVIYRYPEIYWQYRGNRPVLDQSTLDYLEQGSVDMPAYASLPSYERFVNAYLDYRVDQLVQNNRGKKHYGLKKMAALLEFVPKVFSNENLKNKWLTHYMLQHLEKHRLANAQPYLDHYKDLCTDAGLKQEVENQVMEMEEARKDHEVQIYKTVDGFQLEAHIFEPYRLNPTEKRPAIVLFHGGGWEDGNAGWAFDRARHYVEMGLVAIAVQYRLANTQDVFIHECMDDARDLIIWTREHAADFGIMPEKIVGYGWSAGGHLVASAALFPESSEEGISSMPNALVLESPAVDLRTGPTSGIWKMRVFGPGKKVGSANPAEHVRSGLPPALILQGRDDTVTPLEGAQNFREAMLKHGNLCELIVYDDVGHLYTPSHLSDKGNPQPDPVVKAKAQEEADRFIQQFRQSD